MATTLYYDERFLHHETGVHPERPERVRRARQRLKEAGVDSRCTLAAATPVAGELLATVHAPEQINLARKVTASGGGYLDGDTPVSKESYDVALLAAGTAVDAVDAVLTGKTHNAFCLVRPPGHHATPKRSMGFCLFNNIALAARHALDKYQLERILIVDWDVHHGNGTQDIFYEDPRVLFFSAHRFPFYPGTGRANETGTGRGLGYTLNLPVAYGTKPATYRKSFAAMLETAARKIKPELVLLSAGFDAHRLDPIGDLGLDLEDFLELGKMVLAIAETDAHGHLVSLLEGGYNIDILAECVEQHVGQLLG